MMQSELMSHGVSGAPLVWLRLEGLAVAAAAVGLVFALTFYDAGSRWWIYLLIALAPDLSMLAYLFGPRLGAIGYNAAHSCAPPLIWLAIGFAAGARTALLVAPALWLAHIGVDRALGYGMKYASGFRDTHLGRIGRQR